MREMLRDVYNVRYSCQSRRFFNRRSRFRIQKADARNQTGISFFVFAIRQSAVFCYAWLESVVKTFGYDTLGPLN